MTNVFVDKFSRTARRDTYRSITKRTARGAACASLLGAVALTMISGGANAGTVNGTLAVSANVTSSCTVTGGSINFGSLDAFATVPADVTTPINVKCSNTTIYHVALDGGQNLATGFSRNMKSGTNSLAYQLYSDAARTSVWSNATAGVGGDVAGTGSGVTQPLIVYGRIANLTGVIPGAYADTVTITVTY